MFLELKKCIGPNEGNATGHYFKMETEKSFYFDREKTENTNENHLLCFPLYIHRCKTYFDFFMCWVC